MGTKYEFTGETMNYEGYLLHKIRRLPDGELGGWIQSENNLSQDGNCWVYENAKVYGDARVYGNAKIDGNAEVYGNAQVYDSANVGENAKVYGNAKIYDHAEVYGEAQVYDNAEVYNDVEICGSAKVHGNADIDDNFIIDNGEYTANEASEEFDAITELATYVANFTYRAEDSFDVDIKGQGSLRDLDYENHPECWGGFNGIITYSVLKTSFEITVEFPDYADYSIMHVKLSSKKLGIDVNIDTVEELRTELKHIAEKLTESIGPEGSNALVEII